MPSLRATILSWWKALRVSMILRARLAGANAPGRVTQARRVKGGRPDKE